ncbi:MAG: polymer-forming cytoskeletal protein [Anaerolineae bacterium]|nr:polymer-forming cytoskeletal protein [Anaerolineae bacterium]MDW8100278.1 polymer-forming cytoskeletal protein [Anaerolineae bacterium]
MRRWWWIALAILWLSPSTVLAQTEIGDRTILGQSYTLPSGHRLEGNLAVFGGSATLEEESVVRGDVMVAGGSLDIAGRVEGDVVVMGGSLTLQESAYVDGDVSVLGGSVSRAPGATVTGEMITGLMLGRPGLPTLIQPPISQAPWMAARVSGPELLLRVVLRVFAGFLLATLMAALALAVLSFAPDATRRVGDAVFAVPGLAFIVGLITLVLAIGLALFLAITICFIPIAFLLVMALALAMAFGWIALGWLLGDRLLRALNIGEPHLLLSGVIGVALITLVAQLPCLGIALAALASSLGLGAIVLTRAGTQPYPTPPRPGVPPMAASSSTGL